LKVWRLARRPFAALDGAGARRYGGRWNRPGQAVVYTSQNLSLALLEIIVHLELPAARLPPDYVKIEIEMPDEVACERIESLPETSAEMLELGVHWYESAATVGLVVPSVIVAEENNLLLNATHADFSRLRRNLPRPFGLDPRLFAT
jgi:RES domain-containing protein